MAKSKSRRDKTKETFWKKVLAAQIGSGLSQKAFCMREGLNPNTFSSWKKVIRRRDQEKSAKTETDGIPVFMPVAQLQHPVKICAETNSQPAVAELDLAARTVKIFAGIDRESLKEIVLVLREVAL